MKSYLGLALVSLGVIVFAAFADCAHVTPSPSADAAPPPDDTLYDQACVNLASLGCAEGQEDNCAETLRKASLNKITRIDVACLVSAGDVGTVRTCGSVDCLEAVGTPAATCVNVCAQLKRWKCAEARDCLATCRKASAGKITDLKLGCLVRAGSKKALQACGSVACP